MPPELLPQPPPGVPAPPPGEVALRARWRFLLILGLGVGSILVVGTIAATLISHTLAKRRNADLATVTGNLRSLSSALIEFDSQYSTYPDATTAVVVKESTNSSWIFSDSTSNDLLRQLLAVGILPSEGPLYAKTPRTKKPDNRFSSDTEALAAGECALSYIPGSTARSDPDTPVCLVPLVPGKLTFDREVFDGQAVILCADSRVVVLPIDKSGRAILNGMDLFDPRQPFWHGKAPNVKWPK